MFAINTSTIVEDKTFITIIICVLYPSINFEPLLGKIRRNRN